jgi:hypothetical protein
MNKRATISEVAVAISFGAILSVVVLWLSGAVGVAATDLPCMIRSHAEAARTPPIRNTANVLLRGLL